MPSDLTKNVKNAINNFVALRTSDAHGDIAIDVLRAIRDEAALLVEKQAIFDAFDADALKFYDGDDELRRIVERIKKLIHVIHCTRCVTMDGYSTIDAVIELSKDANMNSVDKSLRLTFKFRREKVPKDMKDDKQQERNCTPFNTKRQNLDRKQNTPTHVTYDIEFSKDYGENKRLLTIEVYAKNNYPSVKEAIPMDDNTSIQEDICDDYGDKMEDDKEQDSMSIVSKDTQDADRYAAYVDPESLQEFLVSAGLELNAENSLFFLMTFPFYEHEWDIFGFLLDCVFGDEDQSDDGYEDVSDTMSGDDNNDDDDDDDL